MGKLQVNGSAGILNDLTVSGNIFSTNIYPNATLSYNIGLSSKEYGDGFIRQIFTRHIEPATNVNNDVYICYNNRGGSIRAYAPLDMSGIGSIVNLPIEGGLYWNPYVESATDGTDAASIVLHASGVGGGTELRISMMNDENDVINLNPAAWIYLYDKPAFRVNDSWLRINETRGFSSGVYFGGSLVRTDSCLQVGDSGAAFGAYNDGTGYFANHLNIGSHVSIWSDSEGGNITLRNPSNGNNIFQFDRCFADGLRLYSSLDGGASGTAEWAFYNDGRFQTPRIIGTDYTYGLRVQSLNRGDGAGWTEGIWIEPAANGYATLALGKTDRSSIVALVHHSDGHSHYLEKKNSRGQWTYLLPEASGELLNAGNYANYAMPTAHWAWSGQSGQPTWVWGGNDYQQYRVWNPSNFNVDSSRYLRATVGNYNAGGLFYGNSSDNIDGSGSWSNWIQLGVSNDWHSKISIPYWGSPKYTRYYADSGSYIGWHDFITSENYTSYCMPNSPYISINNSDPNNYPVFSVSGRIDTGCFILTNNYWTGYGTAHPEDAGITKIVGRVYFRI